MPCRFDKIIIYNYFFIAPDSSPENLTATSLSSSSISLAWSPPSLDSRNGIIREYRINVTEVQTGSIYVFTTSTTAIVVPSLHPYYDYRCTVSAYTVGIGPYSEVVVITTPEDGKLQDYGLIICAKIMSFVSYIMQFQVAIHRILML